MCYHRLDFEVLHLLLGHWRERLDPLDPHGLQGRPEERALQSEGATLALLLICKHRV